MNNTGLKGNLKNENLEKINENSGEMNINSGEMNINSGIINENSSEINENRKQDHNDIKLIKNKKLLAINNDFFNSNFIFYNINNQRIQQFINIIYRSPTIFLDGIVLETPWMKVVKPVYTLDICDSKIYLELTFLGYENDPELKLFYNCMNSIDKTTIVFINKHYNLFKSPNNKSIGGDTYCKNIKNNKLDNEKYSCLRVKIDKSLDSIMFNNNQYGGSIEDLSFENGYVKCWIICNGLWRYNNKIGMSWKAINIKLNNNEFVSDNDSNFVFQFDEDIDDEMNKEHIPNFEMEDDSDYFPYDSENITSNNNNNNNNDNIEISIPNSYSSINGVCIEAFQDENDK